MAKGSDDVRRSSNFAWHICNVDGFLNGPNWQEMHNIQLLYNKAIVDLCFGRHAVLLIFMSTST